jgi:hypothetical protein
MSKTPAKKPAPRREVELLKPIIQASKELKPGKDKARLIEAQINRFIESGHIAGPATKE